MTTLSVPIKHHYTVHYCRQHFISYMFCRSKYFCQDFFDLPEAITKDSKLQNCYLFYDTKYTKFKGILSNFILRLAKFCVLGAWYIKLYSSPLTVVTEKDGSLYERVLNVKLLENELKSGDLHSSIIKDPRFGHWSNCVTSSIRHCVITTWLVWPWLIASERAYTWVLFCSAHSLYIHFYTRITNIHIKL